MKDRCSSMLQMLGSLGELESLCLCYVYISTFEFFKTSSSVCIEISIKCKATSYQCLHLQGQKGEVSLQCAIYTRSVNLEKISSSQRAPFPHLLGTCFIPVISYVWDVCSSSHYLQQASHN